MIAIKSPWILSARFDLCFILAPAILVSVLVILFADTLQTIIDMPPWLWLLLVVGIDAGHVYSSLFRTYFDKQTLARRPTLLTLTPVLVWPCGCMLYSVSSLWFWRVLAYLAVIHFIRQQYGFMMIYSRYERDLPRAVRLLDKLTLYASTLYPLIVWHTSSKQFNWFVADDFIFIEAPVMGTVAKWFYAALLTCYVMKEISLWCWRKQFNVARNLIIFGTALSWHIGIVTFDNDLSFTATNVIAHGVPYYALIWAYGYKCNRLQKNAYTIAWFGRLFSWRTAPFYIVLLVAFAYLEEGFWDGLVWREHPSLFGLFNSLPEISSTHILVWLVPLLTVPQATHYILDAFIWRLHSKNSDWQRVLFFREN